MLSIRSLSMLGLACAASSLVEPVAYADVPPISFNSIVVSGSGNVRGDSLGAHYENAYDHLTPGFDNIFPISFPGVMPTGRISGSGNTGGGFGGPRVSCFGSGRVDIGGDSSDPANLLRMSGSSSANASLPATGPGETGFSSFVGVTSVDFTISAPVFGVWSGTAGSALKFNNVPMLIGGDGNVFLLPGNYTAVANMAGSVAIPSNSGGGSGGAGASFSMLVGIPSPGVGATIAISGLLARTRRRRISLPRQSRIIVSPVRG